MSGYKLSKYKYRLRTELSKTGIIAGVTTVILFLIMLFPFRQAYAVDSVASPRELELYNPEVDTIYLKWHAVPDAEQYYVYMSTSMSSGFEMICGLTENKIVLKGLQDDTTYYFRVYAYGNGGISKSSNIVSGKTNIKGIDVSYHNGIIDWDTVKASGLVDFAIIRCGYGDNYIEQDDIKFVYNVQECSRLDIPMGVYLYSYAMNTAQAQSEADHTLRMIAGHKFDYKVWYDLEDAGTTEKLSAGEIGDIAETFCNSITNAGFDVGIYANKHWFTNILTDARFNQWPKWVAQYNDVCTYDGVYIMWQYASDGSIPGIEGNVDVNYAFTGVYADLTNVMIYDVSEGLQQSLPTPGNVKTTIINKNKVILSWNRSEGSEKYAVYRSTHRDGGFKKIAETTKSVYTDERIPSGVSYYYMVRAYSSLATSDYSSIARAKLYVNQPTSLKAEKKAYNKIKLTWNASSDATGYEIYRCSTEKGTYTKIAVTANTYYLNSGVFPNQRYYYKVRAIRTVNRDLALLYSTYTNVANAKTILEQPSNVKAVSSGYNTIRITFSPVEGATEYEIYRSVYKNGTYKKIKTTTETSFYNSGLTTGLTYFYKVRAVRTRGTATAKSEFGEKVWRAPKLGTVSNLKVTSASAKKAYLSWSAVNGASGYLVYRCSSINGTYTKVGQTASNSYTDSNRTSGKKYYYKVRAYRNVNGKIRYGAWSSPKSVKIK